MTEVLCWLCGLVLGAIWTRRSGRRLGTLLRQRRPGAAIAAAAAARLLPVVALLVPLAMRWPAGAAGALVGYWSGRTAWLAYVATGHGWEG